MNRLSLPAALLATGAACALPVLPTQADPCGPWEEPGFYRLPVDGYSRRTLVQMPQTAGPRPLVMALHGYSGNSAEFANEVTRFRLEGPDEGAVVAFPQGSGIPNGHGWNAGWCCGTAGLGADDVGFLDAVAEALEARACTDEVLATGHSNGSMMAARWACESDIPDAVVGSAGPLLTGECGGRPIPVSMVVGTSDPTVPPQGGSGAFGSQGFPPAKEAFEPWLERNGCQDPPDERRLEEASWTEWTCDAPTRFISLDGWRHAFPGGRRNQPATFDFEGLVWETLRSLRTDLNPEG